MTINGIAIDIKNLTKFYKGNTKPALDNISLSIPQNTIFGLLGPNGAGKTTTIKILCGLLSLTGGEVIIDGKSLNQDFKKIRKVIGVVPQDIALYPTLTARENLSVFGGLHGLKGKNLSHRIEELLQVFGLEKSQHTQIRRYSGGMKRRINLIAGLLNNPKILFLDEPTVGVDVQSKNVILDNLLSINKNGTTIIYTSHYLEEAENICKQIAIIDEGRIISEGTPGELILSNPSFKNLEDVYLHLTGKKLRD
jgi:ABC-2 type transport system ATP-binding protein